MDNRPATTLARTQRIVALLGEGLGDEAVAERLGLHIQTVQRHRRMAIGKRRPNNALDEETVERIRRLHDEEEWPPGEIAETLGVSLKTVHRHLGPTTSGREWNAVARWASKNHNKLWEELRA